MLDHPFWGDITSTIDWCEVNYKISPYIAEPFNTISNLSFIVLGIAGIMHEIKEKTVAGYQTMYATVIAIGIGSMLFHGTLTVWGQQLDELPMVWHLLICMYIINRGPLENSKNGKLLLAISLGLYGIIFSIGHLIFKTTTAFQVHFGVLLAILLMRVYHRFRHVELDRDAKHVIYLFFISGITGFICWLIDYHYCDWIKTSFGTIHSWWHIFMGYSAFCSVVMLKILDNAHIMSGIDIKWKLGIPFAYRIRSDDEKLINISITKPDVESNVIQYF